jgi:MerR family copper efflux transcriptional regulator
MSALTIGSLAKQTGCNVPTIRHYEEIGLLPPANRRPAGHRIYTDADLKRLTFIRRCRDLGLPIAQVRELLSLAQDPERDCTAARNVAAAHLKTVREKLADLRVLERTFTRFVEDCSQACAGGPARDCVILEDLAAPANGTCCGTKARRIGGQK